MFCHCFQGDVSVCVSCLGEPNLGCLVEFALPTGSCCVLHHVSLYHSDFPV